MTKCRLSEALFIDTFATTSAAVIAAAVRLRLVAALVLRRRALRHGMNLHVVDVVVQLEDERGVAGFSSASNEASNRSSVNFIVPTSTAFFIRTMGASFTCSGICIMILLVF